MTTETLTFIDPDGDETPLTSDTMETLWGLSGRFMPPISFVEEEVPEQPGGRIRNVKTLGREIAVPIYIEADTQSALRVALRSLARKLYPARGDGLLRAVAPDGETREIVCRYSTGYQLVESRDQGGRTWQKTILVFRAAQDPFWRDVDPIELTFSTGEPPVFFPFFPLRLARSSVFGGVTIDNEGDVDTWPIWTITGPGENLTLTNETTGESISMTTVLGAGDTITIDTTPGVKTIVHSDTSNLFPDLLEGSTLFALVPGDNEITVGLDTATDDSEVALSYRHRYLTP